MLNKPAFNLGLSGSGGNPGASPVEDEFSRTREVLEHTRNESRRTRIQVERQQELYEAHQRRTKVLSIILGILIVCLAGAVWYAYPMWQGQQKAIGEMVGLQTVAGALGQRLTAAEGKLTEMTGGLPALSNRMDQLQAGMKTNLQTARTQAQAFATQVGQQIRADVNQSMQLIQSRLGGLESNQKESVQRVVQLEEQMAGLRREIATLRDENSAAAERLKQLGDVQQTGNTELVALNERMTASQAAFANSQAALNSLSTRLERKRVDFELSDRRPHEVAPGIYLTVKRANAGRQEVDGSLQLGAKGKNMAIRGQGVQQPTVFYTQGESRPAELVLTQISNNRVSGYVMVPVPLETKSQ